MQQDFSRNLPDFIQKATDFNFMMNLLSSEQRALLFEVTKTKLPKLIDNASSINSILQVLSPDQCCIALKAIQEELSRVIRNDDDFKEALKGLSNEQRNVAKQTIKQVMDFESLIQNVGQLTLGERAVVYDFQRLLEKLSPKEKAILFEGMGIKSEKQKQPTAGFLSFFNSPAITTETQNLASEDKLFLGDDAPLCEDDRDYTPTWCERALSCFRK